jgi:hypothetical protein
MEAITFEQLPTALTLETLPKAFTQLSYEVHEIKRLLQLKSEPQQQTDQWFDLNELCNYLPEKPAKPTVYGWVHSSIIPFHKRAKKLFFLKSEIDTWLKTGRKKTVAEIAAEADQYLQTKKGLNNGK